MYVLFSPFLTPKSLYKSKCYMLFNIIFVNVLYKMYTFCKNVFLNYRVYAAHFILCIPFLSFFHQGQYVGDPSMLLCVQLTRCL